MPIWSISIPTPPKGKWPLDIAILAALAGNLWAITLAWYVFDLNRLLALPIRSEADAWLFGLSGILLFYIFVSGVVAAWGFILSIPTCLLAANICFVNFRARYRWPIAIAISAALMLALSHFGIVTAAPSMQPMQKAFETRSKAEAPAKNERTVILPLSKATTLRDLDPSLPPTPLSGMNQQEVIAQLEKGARARCISPKDADIIDACARFENALKWGQEPRPGNIR